MITHDAPAKAIRGDFSNTKRGIVLTAPHGKAVEVGARDAGFLVNAATPDLIRLAPPLVISEAQIDALVAALPAVLDAAVASAEAS